MTSDHKNRMFPGRGVLGATALVLISLSLACSSVEKGDHTEPLVKWVPAGQSLPREKPANASTPATPAPAASPAPAADNKDIVAAIEKVAEACRSPLAMPVPEAPAPAEKVSWPPAGPQLVDALADVLSGMGRSALGFRLNDMVIGRIMDNGTSEQAGELEAVRSYLKFILAHAAPANTGPLASARAALLEGDLDKWWFPSGEKTLDQGIAALHDSSAAVKSGAIRSPGGPRDLKALLLLSSSLLAAQSGRLSATEVNDPDLVFYHARGVAEGVAEVLAGAQAAYASALEGRGADGDMKHALDCLQAAADVDPLIVEAATPGSLRANHLLLLAFHLDRAAAALQSAADRLD